MYDASGGTNNAWIPTVEFIQYKFFLTVIVTRHGAALCALEKRGTDPNFSEIPSVSSEAIFTEDSIVCTMASALFFFQADKLSR
jgi:hypothetical protein